MILIMDVTPPEPVGLDPIGIDRPSPARMYDYVLGGSHNFAVDRDAADQAISGFPLLADGMRENRAFLARVVRYLAQAGVDQFLDLGSGIPTSGNVHEVARETNPDARVVYVDTEPVAVMHSLALLENDPLATAIRADLRRPAEVLADPAVRALLDFDRPVAVLIVGTMHFIRDVDHPADIVAGYRDALAPGSHLALTNGTDEGQDPVQTEAARRAFLRSPTPLQLRDRDEVAAMLAGLELVEPGLVAIHEWRPESPSDWSFPFAWGALGLVPGIGARGPRERRRAPE
jgi:hypothetical protein